MDYEDAGTKCMAIFEHRCDRTEAAIASLPPLGQWLLRRWRAEIERAGRAGPTGCCYSTLLQFALDVKAVLEPEYPTEKILNLTERGSGA